jgi:hypothetical protein
MPHVERNNVLKINNDKISGKNPSSEAFLKYRLMRLNRFMAAKYNVPCKKNPCIKIDFDSYTNRKRLSRRYLPL